MHHHDSEPCWSPHCAPHLTHSDASTRELIAEAEARGAERVAQAVEARAAENERLAAVMERAGYDPRPLLRSALDLREALAEHRDERPAPEPPSDVTEDEQPKWADMFGAAPGINLCGEADEVTERELAAIIRNAVSLNDPAATAQWMRDHLHVTRREATR